MAQATFAIADFNQASYFKSWTGRDGDGTIHHGYTTPSNNTQTYSVQTPLPAGSAVNWATINFSDDLGTYGGTATPASGSGVSASNDGWTTVSWYWKSNTGGSYPSSPAPNNTNYLNKTGLRQLTGIYVLVDYTVPTAPTINRVTVNSSAAAIYAESGSAISLAWTASHGTLNNISSYKVDGTTRNTPWATTAPTNSAKSWSVVAIAPYGNSAAVSSPIVYGYKAVGVAGNVALSNTTPNAGTTIRLSWTAPAAVNYNTVSGYKVYYSNDNSTYTAYPSGTTTNRYLDVTCHPTMGSSRYFKIVTTGTRKNSGYSATVYAKSKVYTAPVVPKLKWSPTTVTSLPPSTSRTLTWTSGAGTNNAVLKYEVHSCATSGGTYARIASPTAASQVLSSPAVNGYTYFKVRAMGTNTSFNSAFSSVVSLQTVFTAPKVTAVKIGGSTSAVYALKGTSVTLSWTGTGGTNNAITSYSIAGGSKTYTTTSTSISVPAHATESSSYTYKVTAIAPNGNSTQVSAPVLYSYSAVTAPSTVGVASNNVAPGASISLSWSGATGGGTYNKIASYDIYSSVTPGSGYKLLKNVASSPTNVVSSSSNGSIYYKIVTKGSRAYSAQSTVYATLTTQFTAPTVTGIKIAGSSSGVYVLIGVTSLLSWTGNAGTNNNIISYDIYRNGVAWQNTTSKTYSVVSHTTVGSSYYYTIYPKGKYSTGSGVKSPTYYSCSLPTLPKVFTSSPAIPDATTQFTISWSGANDGTLNAITGYEVYKSSTLGGTYTLFASTSSLSTTDTSHGTMGSSYFYKIKTIGASISSGLSNALTVTSQTYTVPNPPYTVLLSKNYTLVPNESITLSWSGATAGTNNAITGYNVYRSTTSGGSASFVGTTTDTSLSVISNESYGGKYYYTVRTKGTKTGFLEGVASTEALIETADYTKCSNPSGLNINGGSVSITIDAVSASFTWSASNAGINNAVTGYFIQEQVLNSSNAVVNDWRSATNLSSEVSNTTATTSILVYPPTIMAYYKKFRVKAVGSVAGFDSDYVELPYKVYRKLYTNLSAPIIPSVPNVAEGAFTLSWSGVSNGSNNNVSSYEIQYKNSLDGGSTWSSWQVLTTVSSASSSGSYSVPVNSVRGSYRIYRIRALGTAGSSWYSIFTECNAVKTNLVPTLPVITYPKNNATLFGNSVYVGITLSSEPESQTQKIVFQYLRDSTVLVTNETTSYPTSGLKIFRTNSIDSITTGSGVVLKIKSIDALGGESEIAQINLTKSAFAWTRAISTGTLIGNHIADINDMVSKVNVLRQYCGLSTLTLSTPVGYFSNWYSQMVQIRTSLAEVYQAFQLTVPTWINSTTKYPNAAIFNQIKTAIENLVIGA